VPVGEVVMARWQCKPSLNCTFHIFLCGLWVYPVNLCKVMRGGRTVFDFLPYSSI
jgi:hypothetical protein